MDLKRLWIAPCLVLVVVASACGGDEGGGAAGSAEAEPKTYDENDVTFEYPDGWEQFDIEAAAMSTGSNELWNTTVGPEETNLVNVTAYQLNFAITEANVGDIRGELDGVIGDVVAQAEGEIASGPTETTVSGLPGFEYEWADVEVDGEPKDSRAVFVFDGEIEYFFNCQFDEESREEILDGCQLILDTFESSA